MYAAEPTDRFTVQGTTLRYASEGLGRWELIAEQILLLGEATSEDGARDERWHLCFVTDIQGRWVEGSLYAEGRNDALQWLSVRMGCSLELKLAGAPAFRSRVMWPPDWRERPLFAFQVSPLRRAFSGSLRRLGLPPLVGSVQSVDPRLLESLWRAKRHPGGAVARFPHGV
ncbi:MAG TPA: hypothetical protein VIY54_11840 [Steroidobacteraceae bacterium]